jgi:hypothetical protein
MSKFTNQSFRAIVRKLDSFITAFENRKHLAKCLSKTKIRSAQFIGTEKPKALEPP